MADYRNGPGFLRVQYHAEQENKVVCAIAPTRIPNTVAMIALEI